MAIVTQSTDNSSTSPHGFVPQSKEKNLIPSISVGRPYQEKLDQTSHFQNCSKTNRIKKSKNVPKNVSKAIIQQILNKNVMNQITDQDEFLKFIIRHKNLKSSQSHQNNKTSQSRKTKQIVEIIQIDLLEFSKKEYIPYVFNSKIKNPEGHLKYRIQFMKVFAQQQ